MSIWRRSSSLRAGQLARVLALVVAPVLREAARERLHALLRGVAGERRHRARVQAAAEVGGHRHVAAQVQGDRLAQQRLDALLEVLRRVVEVEVVVDLPVALGRDPAVADPHAVAGQELAHALEQGLAGQAELEGQVVLEPLEVRADGRQERQQRLRLRGEVEDVADLGVVERLDPEAVARAEQLLLALVPERVGEHAAQAVERVRAPAVVGAHHDLGVAVGPEAAAADLRAQLGVVVDLAVVGEPAVRVVAHRLVPGGRGIDDREPAVTEPDVAALVRPDARVVGPAMGDQAAHRLEARLEIRDRLPAHVYRSTDAAHGQVTV